jgi:hypothetical protein
MCCTTKIGGVFSGMCLRIYATAAGPPVEAAIDMILSLVFALDGAVVSGILGLVRLMFADAAVLTFDRSSFFTVLMFNEIGPEGLVM